MGKKDSVLPKYAVRVDVLDALDKIAQLSTALDDHGYRLQDAEIDGTDIVLFPRLIANAILENVAIIKSGMTRG